MTFISHIQIFSESPNLLMRWNEWILSENSATITKVAKVATFFTLFSTQENDRFLASMNWINLTQLLSKTDI